LGKTYVRALVTLVAVWADQISRLTLPTDAFLDTAEWATKQVLRKTAIGEEIKSGSRKTLHRTRSKIEEALLTGELEVMKKPEWVEKNPLRRSSLLQSTPATLAAAPLSGDV
jgi:hypothetical protein